MHVANRVNGLGITRGCGHRVLDRIIHGEARKISIDVRGDAYGLRPCLEVYKFKVYKHEVRVKNGRTLSSQVVLKEAEWHARCTPLLRRRTGRLSISRKATNRIAHPLHEPDFEFHISPDSSRTMGELDAHETVDSAALRLENYIVNPAQI